MYCELNEIKKKKIVTIPIRGAVIIWGKHLLEGVTYFNAHIKRCGASQRAVLISGPALIRENAVCEYVKMKKIVISYY